MIKVDWGTDQKCDICGSRKDLWYEPRFHYYSCEEHKDIAPAHRHELKDKPWTEEDDKFMEDFVDNLILDYKITDEQFEKLVEEIKKYKKRGNN